MQNHQHLELDIPFSKKIKMIPNIFGIHLEEQPTYDVLRSDGAFEIRCYNAQRVATIELDANEGQNKKNAHLDLTNYIFGHNETKEKMSLTSPVIQEGSQMSFILPYSYFRKAPAPLDRRISIKENPMRVVACVAYHGSNTKEKIAEHTELLKEWLKRHPWYLATGKIQSAEYDGAMPLPFLRRNELHVEVKNIH